MKLKQATVDDLEMIYKSLTARKDFFSHIRRNYIQEQLEKGNVVYYKTVIIIYKQYKRRQTLGEISALPGWYMLHQIINTEPGNGLASKVWDHWVSKLKGTMVLKVLASNKVACKFYEKKGMHVEAKTSFGKAKIPGLIYMLPQAKEMGILSRRLRDK